MISHQCLVDLVYRLNRLAESAEDEEGFCPGLVFRPYGLTYDGDKRQAITFFDNVVVEVTRDHSLQDVVDEVADHADAVRAMARRLSRDDVRGATFLQAP